MEIEKLFNINELFLNDYWISIELIIDELTLWMERIIDMLLIKIKTNINSFHI
jgi:hypothetical protein